MIASLFCFGMAFLLQGILAAGVMMRFENLSEKRRRRQITDSEKWEQAVYSLPAKPILETVLSGDATGMRIIVTTCVVISSLIAIIFAASDLLIAVLALILVAVTWLSKTLE